MRKSFQRHVRCGVAAVLALTAGAAGQESAEQLRPLDQTIIDRTDISHSLRVLSPEISRPSGFESLYHAPGRDDLYMRVDGGLHAVFPRSRYSGGDNGLYAEIPDNTVFFLGRPSQATLRSYFRPSEDPWDAPLHRPQQHTGQRDRGGDVSGDESASQRRGPRVGSSVRPMISTRRLPADAFDSHGEPEDAGPAIIVDESYRRERLQDMLRRAARAESGRAAE